MPKGLLHQTGHLRGNTMAGSIRSTLGAFFGAVTLLVASSSVAQTVSVPSAGGIASVEIDDSAPRAGTTVSSPNTKLSAFSLSLVASTSKLTVRPQVYAVAGGVVGGSPIWTGPTVDVTPGAYASYTFSPDLTVNSGETYALVVEKTVAGEEGSLEWVVPDEYAGGVPIFYSTTTTSWIDNSFFDAVFSVTFVSAAAPVPTMSEWAMIILGTMMAGGAALYIQRRRLSF